MHISPGRILPLTSQPARLVLLLASGWAAGSRAGAANVVRRPLGPPDVGPVWMRSVGLIRTVAVAPNSVTLTWDSPPALTYQIQFSGNLLDWATVSQTISNLQTSASWADDGSQTGSAPDTQTERFYRIRLAPQRVAPIVRFVNQAR